MTNVNAVNVVSGLVAKSHASVDGVAEGILNVKVNLPAEEYAEIASVMKVINKHYNGGLTAIVRDHIRAILPELKAMADAAVSKSGNKKPSLAKAGGVS